MSNTLLSNVNCGNNLKFPSNVQKSSTRVQEAQLQNSPILVLTVEYPQNGKVSDISELNAEDTDLTGFNTEQDHVQRVEDVPYSLVEINSSDIKEINYEGDIEIEGNKSLGYSPVLVLRNDTKQDGSMINLPKGSYSIPTLLNNFLFNPSNKSVVCNITTKDVLDTNKNINSSEVSESEIVGFDQNEIIEERETLHKMNDFEECPSEDDSVQVIADKPVDCRAIASLPANFVYFSKSTTSESRRVVLAKRQISRRALFGPMEGLLSADMSSKEHYLDLSIENNGGFERLDVSNEDHSNWMRYVRKAETQSEQNLNLHQLGKNLYFSALRTILPNEELKVGYSDDYAAKRNLPLFSVKSMSKSKNQNEVDVLRKENVVASSSQGNEVSNSKWRCTHCQRSFRSATLFNLHVLTHAADNIETNANCDIDSSKESDSFCVSRSKKKHTCNECSKSFSSNSALAGHTKSHASVKMFDCPICKEIFYKISYLKEHIPSHCVDGQFFCPHCSKKYQEYRHIRNHIRRFHSGKHYLCIHCSKCFASVDKLKLHLVSHSETREFSCAICGKQFKRKDKLSSHVKRMHLSNKRKEKESACPDEEKSSKKIADAKDYSEYVYKCHICVLGFKRRGMLVNHLAKLHPGITPESVPELNLPILRATRDYYCQYCAKIYKSSSKRKAHILKNHPGSKLPLSDKYTSSSKESDQNETYSQTVGSVTTNPQGCEWCHKQYASKAKLLQHQRKKHPTQLPKELQRPKKPPVTAFDNEESDSVRDAMDNVTSAEIFLPDPLDMSEYELSVGDSKFFADGEFIVDGYTLKRAIKEETLAQDCSPETLTELGQIIEYRPDGYFKVYQGPSGITLAQPVEVWDPMSLCLSPPSEPSHMLQPAESS